MNPLLLRQAQRLLQGGLVLVLYASVEAFVIPHLASPRLGASVRVLIGFHGALLLAQGLLWPRLALGRAASLAAFWCSLYTTVAILAAYMLSAGSGELPHGLTHGTPLAEILTPILAYSAVPTGLTAFVLLVGGLCRPQGTTSSK